ncbi:hypothetical protein M2282_000864 [Variovorax boronicumulans]|uniref:hypothetical protein n=1 Tax=Variovorax boronicumulans TaxID=436515 RepID=UPI002474EF89|nr:hypothetical protein [Variovorax boronicumulans]MDH6165736.1 hypothetical protein [Variovorax boronicumulans]
MRTLTPTGERESTAHDHGRDRLKAPLAIEREQCESMRRVTGATGASAHELKLLMQRLVDIDRSGKSAGIVAQGNIAADRIEAEVQLPDLGDGSIAEQQAEACQRIDFSLLEPLNPAHDKKWYARWKFWSFILGAAGPVASLTLQGLALRPSEPEDAHADLVAKARKVLESWRRTSDPLFWSAVEDYVRQQAFSLETQAYLMHCIAAVFSGDTMKLSNEQSEQLAGLVTQTYLDALGTAATMPSSDIYRCLAEGLEATDRETGLRRMLGRSDAAQIAMTTLVNAIGHGGSH